MRSPCPQARTTSLAACLALALGSVASAVPYPSGVRNTSGGTWEFILNESADTVTIERDGGSPVVLSDAAAGRHSFDMTGFSTFDITVSNSAPAEWTELSDASNLFTSFNRAAGLAINRDPASPYFGTLYVSNSVASTTDAGRSTGDGIYSMTADLQGVDLTTSGWTVPSPNDTSQARVGQNWQVGASNSPYRIALDDSGNVVVGDYSDELGGLKYIGADLSPSSGGLLLEGQEGVNYGYLDPAAPLDGSVSPWIHGSIRGVPNVTGTVGVDLVVSAMDEDLTRDPIGLLTNPPDPLPTDGNHVWRWNLGAETNSKVKPELLIDAGGGAGQLGSDSEGRPYMIALNVGVRADAEFFPQLGDNGLWILTSPRYNGDESGVVIVEVDETGVEDPQVLWASRQWTIDNDLDGFPNDPEDLGQSPHSDVFRNSGSVDVSPDGKTLYIHRWLVDHREEIDPDRQTTPDINPYVGRESEHPGAVLVVPLNDDGIPVIEIDDNGTPGDTSDDILTNLQSIETFNQLGQNENHEIEVDAAGNVYITDSFQWIQTIEEVGNRLQVFSPGGDTTTVYSYDGSTGSFLVVTPTEGIAGDYNDDGFVDAADYTLWRDGDLRADADGNGVVDTNDYNTWASNYGASASSASAGSAAPEPTAAALLFAAACLSVTRPCGRREREK